MIKIVNGYIFFSIVFEFKYYWCICFCDESFLKKNKIKGVIQGKTCYNPLRREGKYMSGSNNSFVLLLYVFFLFLFFAFWYYIIKKIVMEIKAYKNKKMELMQAQLDYYKKASENDTQ